MTALKNDRFLKALMRQPVGSYADLDYASGRPLPTRI